MNKVSALWALFRQGEQVADPAKWHARKITATLVAGVIVAAVNVLKAFGYELPIDQNTANQIGVGVIAVVNVVLTITASSELGLPAAKPDRQGAADGAATAGGVQSGGGSNLDRGNDYIG